MVFGGDGAAVRGGRNPGDGGRVGCTAGKRASKCATRSILRYVDFAAIRKHGRLSVRQVRFDRRATHGAHRLVRSGPRPSRAAPPPPRQAWSAPRPRHGPARTLAGPCARGARERSFWSGFFPSAQLFCDPRMWPGRFLPPGGVQCVRPRSVQLLYPPAVSPADTLYPPHVDTCSACPSHVSIRCIPYEHGVSERAGPLAGPRCGRSSGRLFVPSRASGWVRRGVAGSAAASSVR